MNRHIPALLAAASFSFLGLFGPDREYGDLTGALQRTMAQSAPPYHITSDTTQTRMDSGAAPGPTDPARTNPPAAAEQTPKVP